MQASCKRNTNGIILRLSHSLSAWIDQSVQSLKDKEKRDEDIVHLCIEKGWIISVIISRKL